MDATFTVEEDETCLQELVPNLFVALVDEDGHSRKETLQVMRSRHFTHFIRISSGFPTMTSQKIEHIVEESGAQKLHLLVPADTSDDGQTILKFPQLLAARDFLSQAMPRHYHLTDVPGKYPATRILITTSNKWAADAMSVAACYLAFESGKSAGAVLECINEEEDILGTWRGIISRDGIDVVELVARTQHPFGLNQI
jgi:hypothetical protein